MSGFKRTLLIIGGTFFVALGAIGLLVPVLPTTPMLLLAAVCYARSSATFYNWLMTNRWFGEYIRNYREGRGILLKQKVIVLALLWLTILYAALFAVTIWWLKAVLVAIAIAVSHHVITIRTYRPEVRQAVLRADCDASGEAT